MTATAVRDDLPKLEKYELLGEIGHGGMATVYRARDLRLGREVAVKIIHRHLRDNREVATRFIAEGRAAAKLKHRGIVEVYDVSGEDERERYLVAELVRGPTLRQLLVEHRELPAEIGAAMVIELAAALDHAHASGVIHRDIKPENVLLSRYGTPKLADFGIARQRDEERNLTRTGSVLGTWAFMAPEQRTDAKSVDARADLYAVAATLFNLVTARDPFDLYTAEVHDELFGDVPPNLRAFLSRATRYKPSDRFSSATEMREALRALGEEFPLRAPEIPEPEVLAKRPTPPPAPVPPTADLPDQDGLPELTDSLAPNRSGLTDHDADPPLPRWLGLMAILALVVGLTGYWRWQHPTVPRAPTAARPPAARVVEPPPTPEVPVEAPAEVVAEPDQPPESTQAKPRPRPREPENPWTAPATSAPAPSTQVLDAPASDVARIVVQSQPPGQEIFVNRVSVGRTPLTATVTARRNRIAIVGPKGQEQSYTITTSAGDIETVCYDFDANRDCAR